MLEHGLNNELVSLIEKLAGEEALISDERKGQLIGFSKAISRSIEKLGFVNVIFVCTHNSRRSQLGQAWMRAAASYYGLDNVYTFSGGTESTAFNYRMVAAVERAGFMVKKLDDRKNPKYLVHLSEYDDNHDIYFSKKFSESYNPDTDFIAVMVCSDADEACPFVPGAMARISLPYTDPKSSDNTSGEASAYDEKVLEIGREIIFTVRQVSR
jgi:protein-tyrosine phosphatase/arsenate reductase